MPNRPIPDQPSKPPSENKATYFGESNEVDPTPGWIPFFFVLAFAVVFLTAFVIVAIFVR